MRKLLFITVCGLMGVMTALAQPLLKTHVETGDLEGVLNGNTCADALGMLKAKGKNVYAFDVYEEFLENDVEEF